MLPRAFRFSLRLTPKLSSFAVQHRPLTMSIHRSLANAAFSERFSKFVPFLSQIDQSSSLEPAEQEVARELVHLFVKYDLPDYRLPHAIKNPEHSRALNNLLSLEYLSRPQRLAITEFDAERCMAVIEALDSYYFKKPTAEVLAAILTHVRTLKHWENVSALAETNKSFAEPQQQLFLPVLSSPIQAELTMVLKDKMLDLWDKDKSTGTFINRFTSLLRQRPILGCQLSPTLTDKQIEKVFHYAFPYAVMQNVLELQLFSSLAQSKNLADLAIALQQVDTNLYSQLIYNEGSVALILAYSKYFHSNEGLKQAVLNNFEHACDMLPVIKAWTWEGITCLRPLPPVFVSSMIECLPYKESVFPLLVQHANKYYNEQLALQIMKLAKHAQLVKEALDLTENRDDTKLVALKLLVDHETRIPEIIHLMKAVPGKNSRISLQMIGEELRKTKPKLELNAEPELPKSKFGYRAC